MNVVDIVYDFPSAAYLLFLIPLFLVLFWLFYQYRLKVLSGYAAKQKLNELLIPRRRGYDWIRAFALCIAWIGLCLALMQPKGNPRYPEELTPKEQNANVLRLQPHEVIFLIDASASMSVTDGRLEQSRLENAKEIADQVISKLQGQSGSLYAFTSEVSKLSPPSMDYLFMRLMLRNININEGDVSGTDIKSALQFIHDNYLNPSLPLIKTLIIISDGGDNRLEQLQGKARENYIEEVVSLLGDPKNEKLQVYTIGVGSKKGGTIPNLNFEGKSVPSQLNEELLQALSEKGNGFYYSGNTYAAGDIAANLNEQISKADVFAPESMTHQLAAEDLVYTLYYQFPLGLALLALAYSLFWPETSILKQKILNSSKGFLIFLLILPGWLGAATPEEQLRLAADYYEAEDYPEAIQIYEALSNSELNGWERSVVTYNLGAALAAQGENEKASEVFQKIPIDANTSPLLTSRVRNNLVTVNFREAEKIKEAIDLKIPDSQDLYFKSIYFFKQALNRISLAEQAKCRLYQILGSSCPQDANLLEMGALSKFGIAEISSKARDSLVHQATLQQGLPWLATGLNLIDKDIDFMLENEIPSSLQASYTQFFSQQFMSWNALWKSLQEKLKDQSVEKSHYEKASVSFMEMLKATNEGDFKLAKKHLNSSAEELSRFMHQIFAADSFHELLSSIDSDLSLAALQDPLEANTLLYLQQRFYEISIPKAYESFKLGLDAVRDNLDHSLAATERHQDILAKMYFNEAWRQLSRLLLLLVSHLKENPEVILQAAIDEQQHALTQTRLLSRFSAGDSIPETAKSFALNSQEYLILFSQLFYDAAYVRQVQEFTAEVPQGEEDRRCQFYPWNDVFPLFQEGVNGVVKTVKMLKAPSLDLNLIKHTQENVLNAWRKALEQLRAPKRTESCHANPLSVQAQEGKAPAQSFEDLARLIQHMNNDDQQQAAPSQPVKEGLKPW